MKKVIVVLLFLAVSVNAQMINLKNKVLPKETQCTQKYVTTSGVCGQSKYSLFPSCMGGGTYTCVNNIVAAGTPACASTAVNNCPRGIGGCTGTIIECRPGSCGGPAAPANFGVWQNGQCE